MRACIHADTEGVAGERNGSWFTAIGREPSAIAHGPLAPPRATTIGEALCGRSSTWARLSLVLGLLILSRGLFAAEPVKPLPDLLWEGLGGPHGALSYDVKLHPRNPDIVFMTDLWSGVNRSLDCGRNWRPINHGIVTRCGPSEDAIPVFVLEVHPLNPNIFWAGSEWTWSIYKSVDAGKTWKATNRNAPKYDYGATVMTFAFHPTDVNTVYCGADIRAARDDRPSAGAILMTTDGGDHWREVHRAGAPVTRILVNPRDPKTVYASTGISVKIPKEEDGVLKSADGGASWHEINEGLDNWAVNEILMDPRNPNVLYAATGGDENRQHSPFGGVFKTTNGGDSWTSILGSEQPMIVIALAMAPSNPDLLVAGLAGKTYRTTNGGESWEMRPAATDGSAFGVPMHMAIDPRDPDVIYSNNQFAGIFKTTDGGRTWRPSNHGYSGNIVPIVDASRHEPDAVYAGSLSGLFKSPDLGVTWKGLNRGLLDGRDYFVSIKSHPARKGWLLGSDMYSGAIFLSEDDGASWRQAVELKDSQGDRLRGGVRCFAHAPARPDLVYAVTVCKHCYDEYPSHPLPDGAGIYRSSDGGRRWEQANEGLTLTSMNVLDLAVHPSDPDRALAAVLYDGLFRTGDGGAHWEPVENGPPCADVRAIRYDPGKPSTIYLGAEEGGMFKSEDDGKTWRRINKGMDAEASIRSLVVDPFDPTVLYAGDWRMGLYLSTDRGESWRRMDRGLTTRAILSLDLSRDGRWLYAGTEGGGVFRLRVREKGVPPGPEAPR